MEIHQPFTFLGAAESLNTLISRPLLFLFQPLIKTSRVHYLLHFNVQINQSFFAFCILTQQLNLASFSLNSKYIGSNLFSVLRPVKLSLVTLLIRLTLEIINRSFLGVLKPLNILATPHLIHFNL